MTNEQQEAIRSLRQHGKSYDAIAENLALKKGAVRAFCKKSRLDGRRAGVKVETPDQRFCLLCGKRVKSTNKNGYAQRAIFTIGAQEILAQHTSTNANRLNSGVKYCRSCLLSEVRIISSDAAYFRSNRFQASSQG